MNLMKEWSVFGADRSQPWLQKKGCSIEVAELARNCDALLSTSTWTPTLDAGMPVVLFPVVREGELIDIVAFEPTKPDRFYLRAGVDCMLGADNAAHASVYRLPLRVHETPLEWLVGGMIGCCPLTWDARKHLMGVIEIESSEAMFKSVIASLAEMYPTPKRRAT